MRTQWTDELVVSELKKIASCSDYMPTHNSLRDMGRTDLGSAITRLGGWKHFAALIGKPMTPSDTLTGWSGETKVSEWLSSLGYSCEAQATRTHFDILVNGILRVDVKAASFAEYGVSKGWFYRMGKIITSDIVICARMDAGDYYVFPWFRVPSTNLTISRSGGSHTNYYMNTKVIEETLLNRKREFEIFPECRRAVA